MNGWKRLITMVLAGALSLGCVAGCGSSQSPAGSAAGSASVSGGKAPIITVITNSLDAEMQHMLQAGTILQGQELGYTVNILAPRNAGNTQAVVNDLEAAQTYSDAIVFMSNQNSFEPNIEYLQQIVPAISDARAAGIPLVMMYYDLDDDSYCDAEVKTNNYRAGRALGDQIAKDQPGAVVGLLQADEASKSRKNFERGVTESLTKHGCTVLEDEAIANWNFDTAKSLTGTMLTNHPEMTTIVCVSDWLAKAAVQKVQSAARMQKTEDGAAVPAEQKEEDENQAKPVQVYAGGPSAGGLTEIVNGTIQAEVAENPIQIGRESIVLADRLIHGQPVEKMNRVPYTLVTQENAQEILDQMKADLLAAGIGAKE